MPNGRLLRFDGLNLELKRKCPVCAYPEVASFESDQGRFLAWCPCGTKFDETGTLREPETPPLKEWWERG